MNLPNLKRIPEHSFWHWMRQFPPTHFKVEGNWAAYLINARSLIGGGVAVHSTADFTDYYQYRECEHDFRGSLQSTGTVMNCTKCKQAFSTPKGN